MKKTNKKLFLLPTFISAAITLSSVAPALTAEAAENVTKQTLNTYIYGIEAQTATDCLFTASLPGIPYINPADYFNGIYTVEASEVKNSDGTYTVSNKNGSMRINTQADTLFFEDFNSLIRTDINETGSEQETDYSKSAPLIRDGDVKAFTLDLGDYGIDIIDYDGSAWVPLPTLNDIAVYTYNAAEYIDGDLYYFHSRDVIGEGGLIDRSSLYNSIERTPEIADYTYRELCFAIDNFYGRPSKAAIAASIEENGFDKALDTFSDKTKRAKELLKSTNKTDFFLGLTLLGNAFDDGGHSMTFYDPVTSSDKYPDSAFSEAWKEIMNDPKTEDENNASDEINSLSMKNYFKGIYLKEAKDEALKKYTPVKEWDEGSIKLLSKNDTVVFMFDSFRNEAVRPFKWSLDYAEKNHIKNFVIDLSTNGGGSTSVLNFMMASVTNQKRHTNASYIKELDTATGNTMMEGDILDLNLDGVFDDADKDVAYDFNFAVISSELSFSCGNLMPIMCKENGICLLGDTSGGGSCISSTFFTPEYHFTALSGPIKLVTEDGRDADLGAEVDYPLVKVLKNTLPDGTEFETKSFSDFYNLDLIDILVKEYYAKDTCKYGDVDYDGRINVNDATTIQRKLAGYLALTDNQSLIADVDGDGKVTISDATAIQRYTAEFDSDIGKTGEALN